MPRIASVTARQILDSRGTPTVEATVELDNGISATSSVPSGSVANKVEAMELRDHNTQEYFGLGVSKAVENVNTAIQERLVGQDPLYQTQIDQTLVDLDGTTNKSRLGANAILATSQAVIKAAAASLKLPLFIYVKEKYQLIQAYRIPTPIFNVMNGGRHGSGTLDFQEFQLVPASHLPYNQALRIGVEMFMAIERVLEQKGAIRTVGVEGGFSPNLATNTDALEIFSEAMKLTSYTLAQDAFLGLDVAPKWFFKGGKYAVKDRPQPMNGKQLVKFFQDLHHQYRVFAFEDPLMPDAWPDWKFMTTEMGQTAMVVADDLITTNKTLLMKAIQEQACNAVVIKPNRVGTVTEAIEIVSLAKQAGWHTIMSHRSGETTDDVLADIAVGIGTEYVKFGAPSRGERVAKYNRLLRIEEILIKSKEEMQTGEPVMMDATTQPALAPATQPAPTPPVSPTPASLGTYPSWAGPSAAPTIPTNPPVTPTATPQSETAQVPVPAPTPAPISESLPPATPVPLPSIAPQPAETPAPTATPSPAVMPIANVSPQVTPLEPVTVEPMATPVVPTQASMPVPPPLTAPETSIPMSTPSETTPPVIAPLPPAPPLAPLSPLPEPLSPATPSTTTLPDTNQLQNSLNELVKMVEPSPTPPVTPIAPPAPSAPIAPIAPPVASPVSGPAGLTPPTPPKF